MPTTGGKRSLSDDFQWFLMGSNDFQSVRMLSNAF
nr:MAG TPA: hypothetical protein [Caudoviricetes sp.]